MCAVVLLVRSRSSWNGISDVCSRDLASQTALLAVPLRYQYGVVTYQSREFDVLGEVRLISESLFGSQESQVLSGNVGRRERSAIVSVLEDNTDPMSGLSQLRDDACRAVSIDYREKWSLSAERTLSHNRSEEHSQRRVSTEN
jgi:hypothetical protein